MELKQETVNKLITMLGKDWYEVLKDKLHTQSFLSLSRKIQQERKAHVIYPPSTMVFRAFRETGYYQTKVVLLGMDPYHDGTANGLSFCCGDSDKINPSLRLILKEIDLEYPENKDRIDFGRLDKQDLSRWTKQGVLLLNAALTVRTKTPGSHQHLWKDFTINVIEAINKKHDVVFILLGKHAQEYKQHINNTNFVLEAPHPAAEIYKPGVGFIGSGIFKETNQHLSAINKQEIIW